LLQHLALWFYGGVWFQGSNDTGNQDFGVRASTSDGSLGSIIFTVKQSGNVGIGTASPSSLFSVGSSSQFQVNASGDLVKLKNVTYSWPSAVAGGADYALVSDSSGTLSWKSLTGIGGVSGTGTVNYVPKWTPNTTTLGNSQVFDNGTNVSIGTGSPLASKLHVQSSDTTTSLGKSNASINITNATNAVNDLAEVNFYGYSGSANYVMAGISAKMTTVSGNTQGDLIFGTKNLTTDTALTARMTILSGGNIGIGTTAPTSLFSVGASSQFQVNTSGDLVKIKNITYSWPSAMLLERTMHL